MDERQDAPRVVKGRTRIFEPRGTGNSVRERRIHARYEIARTLVEFLAALAFIVGSVMFFREAWQTAGTWLFLVGSVLFAVRPTLKLVREVALVRAGAAIKE